MLAMDSNTARSVRHPASSLTTIASMLAPTSATALKLLNSRAQLHLQGAQHVILESGAARRP